MKTSFKVTEEIIKKSNENFVRVPMEAIGRIAINPRNTGLVETNLVNIIKDLLKGTAEKELTTEEKIKEYVKNNHIPEELIDSESEIEVPIVLGEVAGLEGLVVVDGYHREKAVQLTKKKEVKAKIQRFASIEDAREEAFRLNEAKGVSLNEADIAFSLYSNYVARLKKDTTVNLDSYVRQHCSKDPLKSKRLVYYAFIKTEILGEDFDIVENGHTIYEYFMAILRQKGYGYLNVPFDFKQQMRDLIEELDYKELFNRRVIIWIRDRQKDLIALNEEFDLVDLVDEYVKSRGPVQISEEETKLAEEAEQTIKEHRNAENEISNGFDSSETNACADIPVAKTIPPVELEQNENSYTPPVKKEVTYNVSDLEESLDVSASYLVSVITVLKATPVKSKHAEEILRDIIENAKMALDLIAK